MHPKVLLEYTTAGLLHHDLNIQVHSTGKMSTLTLCSSPTVPPPHYRYCFKTALITKCLISILPIKGLMYMFYKSFNLMHTCKFSQKKTPHTVF